jgi:hypothetical protein
MFITLWRWLSSPWDTRKFHVQLGVVEDWHAAQLGERLPLLVRVERRRGPAAGSENRAGIGKLSSERESAGGGSLTLPKPKRGGFADADGTRFTVSATVVRPRRGRYTSWPNLWDEEPDPRGHNEGRRLNPYRPPDRSKLFC